MSYNRFDLHSIPKEFNRYIFYKNGFFTVRNDRNSIFITFGRFSSKDVACAAAKLLIKYDWNILKIENDLVSEYKNTFYVFKNVDNTLIFDLKFESYDDAVEYSEINARCNDYHNDIFRNQSKKKGYKDKYKSPKMESSNNVVDDYIFEEKGKFIVKKFKSKNSIIFGKFNSCDVARAARKILLDSNWELNNDHEISFYDDSYWVFEVYENKLLFKGKSESYEDALDIINPPEIVSDKKYSDSIYENPERIIKRKEGMGEKSKPNVNLKINNNGEVIKIWHPPDKKMVQKDIPKRIFVQNCSNEGNKFFILYFDNLMGKIQCSVNSVDGNWQKKYNFDVKDFPEFKLIIRILKTNGWDMSKIKSSSSIYFYKGRYYKIQIIKDNTFIFDMFSSYASAERSRLRCNKIRKIPFKNNCPADIDKIGDYYELVKFMNGKVYKVNGLKSLEKIKSIRDILLYSNWDFDIFYDCDLFYLNGLYWKFNRQGNVINLVDNFESIPMK